MANKVFQKWIADGVEKLLTEKSRAKEFFQSHIESFNNDWLDYEEAKQREEETGEPQPFKPNPSQWQGNIRLCYYTYLAVVYDSVKNVAPYYLCDGILDDRHFGWLQRQISSANFDNDKLTTALKWVETDLEKQGDKSRDNKQKKLAETEQNIAPTKRQRIWIGLKAFIKEIYRLAMRSFFDSAMHK